MNSDAFEGNTQESGVYVDLQNLQQKHRGELESIVKVLANITHISPDKVKPHIDNLLRQLIAKQEERPFHETATPEEWVCAFRAWAASHHHDAPPLSDYAVSRENMYENERL